MHAAPVRANTIPTVTTALRAVESLLMSSGQRTARRNAWTAVPRTAAGRRTGSTRSMC